MKHYRIAFSVLVFTAILMILAAPATATDNKLLLDPDDSSAPGIGDCVDIDIYTDINEVDEAGGTQFDILYDPSCIQSPPTFTAGTDWNTVTFSTASGVCYFTTSVGLNPAISGHKKVGTLHICCDSACCGSWLQFTNALYTKGDMSTTTPATDNGTFLCGKPVEVTKKIWDASTSSWVDDIGPLGSDWMGEDVTFQITVDANCLDLSSVVLTDVLDSGLVYNDAASTAPTSVVGQTITWDIGALAGSSSQTITFNATIDGYGKLYNTATATATVDLLGGVGVSDSDQASEETMPPAGLEVNKTVWDPDAEAWVQNITAVVDYVDIGDPTSEATHIVNGFGPVEPLTHGGGWGSPADGTCRVIWSNVAPDDGGSSASFTMDNPYLNADLLQISVLNGIANDDFDVFVNGDYMYTYIHDPDTTERWVTHSIDVSAYSDQPVLTIELNATGPAWASFDPYGQVAVSWAKLYRNSPVIGDTFRFRCEVHNTGSPGMDLTQIEVWDVISPSLEYADTAMLMTPNGVWRSIEPPSSVTPYDPVTGTTVTWTIDNFLQDPLVLVPCNTFVVEYNVTVIDYGFDCNVQYAKGYADAAGQWVDNSDDACIDTRYPDLAVTEIEVNADLPKIKGYAFAHNCNYLSAVIKEINGVDVSDTFNVKFEVDGDEKCMVAVNGIGALEEKTIWCNCSWTPDSIGTAAITVTVDVDDDVEEASEANNALDKTQDVIYNGYKGNGHQDGRNITNLQCHEQGTINLTYSTGDSYYLSGYYTKWDNYEVNWTPNDFNIPATESCIKKARLYAYYHGDRYGDKWANLDMEFNGVSKTHVAHYSDGKGFETWDYSSNYGVLVYDVTNEFMVSSPNIANLANNNPSEPKGITMEAMLLVVVYNNTETEPERIIWINEGCDLLKASSIYRVSPEEATTYAQFPICVDPIPMNEVVGAKLITVAQTGNKGDDKNRLSFNDGEWLNGLFPDGYVSGTNIGIHEADVRPYLDSTDNIATYQDNGDMFAVANSFLVVEKGEGQIEVVAPEDCIGVTEQFDVLINVTPVIPVYGVEYELSFNSSVIHAEWQNEGDFLKQGSASTNVYINDIDNGAGKVSFAVTRTGTTTGVTEPGTFATIHFTAVELGATTDLTLTSVKASDPDAQPIPVDMFGSTVSVCNNEPPVAAAESLFTYNNVGTKYMSKTYFDGSASDDDGSITNCRWYFGDGNYGAGETYEYTYGSWNWNGASYDPFEVILTVEDDGTPMMANSVTIPVNVYIAGDANGDGEVDIFDATIVGLEWDEECVSGSWATDRKDQADLNNDCVVDIFDAVIIGANWDHTAW